MTQLEIRIMECRSDMRAATFALESHAECSRMLSCWYALQASERELMETLIASDVDVTECGFYVLHELACANTIVARMQSIKLKLLGRLSSMALGGVAGEEAVVVAQLTENAIELTKRIQKRETKLLDHVLWLQQAALHSARGEDDISLGEAEEQQKRGTQWDSIFRSFFSRSSGVSGDVTEKEALSTPKTNNSNTNAVDSKGASEGCSDLQLMCSSLKEAFSAAKEKQYFVAVNEFSLVFKLYTEKCHTLDELLETAFLIFERNFEEFLVEQQGKEDILKRETLWLDSILSNEVGDILSEGSIHKPSYWMSLLFLVLMWDISFCLWRKGCVGEVYRLLSAVDVRRLQKTISFDQEEEDSKDFSKKEKDMNEVSCQLAWRYVVDHCDQGTTHANSKERKNPGVTTATEQVFICEGVHTTDRKLIQIQELLHRITCLRDLSATILYCRTKNDLLYILLTLNSALGWQRNRIQKDEKDAMQDTDKTTSDKHIHMDASGDILTVVLLVVEHFLSNSAIQLMEKSLLLSSSLPLTADVAVRQTSDELISFLTSGKSKGLDDLEEDGLPSFDYMEHEIAETAGDGRQDSVLNPTWIIMQTLGIVQTFASGFRKSEMFQRALSSMKKEGEVEYPQPSWSGLVQSVVSRLIRGAEGSRNSRSTGTDLPRGSSSEYEIEYHSKTHQRQQQQHKIVSLLPLRCHLVENSIEEDGRGVLRFPSLHGDGLALLLGERTKDDCLYSRFEELALRLLVIACRYSDFQTLDPLVNVKRNSWSNDNDETDEERNNGNDNSNGHNNNNNNNNNSEHELLLFVVDKLNNALGNLRSEFDRRLGPSWLRTWHEQRELNASRMCTDSLLKVVQEGIYSNELLQSRLSVGLHSRKDTLMDNEVDTTFTVACDKEDYPHDSLYDPNESLIDTTDEVDIADAGSGEVWDAAPVVFTPSVQFDFSAFTEGSAEALWATRRLIDELTRKHKEEGAAECGISVLPPGTRQLLHEELPAAWQFIPWRLVYSTRFHGFSYTTLVSCSEREMNTARRVAPALLVLELACPAAPQSSTMGDTLMIGACLSHPLHVESRRFYGSNETFVFQVLLPAGEKNPEIRTFRSSGANQQFISCCPHTLAIGGGGGCSIFLNDSVTHGFTAPCPTFASPPLTQWQISSPSSLTLSWSSDATSATMSSSTGTFEFDVKTAELLVVGEKREE